MSVMFRDYHDNGSYGLVSQMRSSIEEDWTPSRKPRDPNRRRPRVIVRRRRIVEEVNVCLK